MFTSKGIIVMTLTLVKNGNSGGLATVHGPLAKTILQGTVKGKKEQQDRRSEKTILQSGQEWILLAQLGQLKTALGGKGLL